MTTAHPRHHARLVYHHGHWRLQRVHPTCPGRPHRTEPLAFAARPVERLTPMAPRGGR